MSAPIHIRTHLQAGDIGYITYLHGKLYNEEYQYGFSFEKMVGQGLSEFVVNYNPLKECVWICEHESTIVGSLFLVDRGTAAQLRYFLIHPQFRGQGLGQYLMLEYMKALNKLGYKHSYLWTTHELISAAHLYTQHGFKLSIEERSHTFGKELTEQRYDWNCV